MGDVYSQFSPHERLRPFATEQVLGAHGFPSRAIDVLHVDLDGVVRIGLLVGPEVLDGPRPLDRDAVLLQVRDEDPLDEALVQERGERVPGVDEGRAARPGPRPHDALAFVVVVVGRVPEGHLEDPRGLVRHDGRFQPHVAQQVQRPRLDPVRATCRRRLRSVVDVLDLVAPSRKTRREHEPDWPGADDH